MGPLPLPPRRSAFGRELCNDDTHWELVERRAHDTPAAIALLHGDTRMSFLELRERAARLAAGLAALGIGKGDVVAVQLPNIPEFVVTHAAISALGAVTQPVHMAYRRAELGFLLAHSEARAFVCVAHFKDEAPATEALALSREISALEHVIALGEKHEGPLFFGDLAASAPLAKFPAVSADDPFLLLYTSGTTDNPKGVPLEARGFLANARLSLPELEIGERDVLLPVAPLTHLYGLWTCYLSLYSGAAISLLPAFSPVDLAALVAKHRASCIFAVPAHFRPILEARLMERHDFSSVRFVCLSGSAVPPALAEAIEAKLAGRGGKAIQLFGMSELQAGAYARPRDPAQVRHGTAGAAAPGTELRVVDDAGASVGPDVEGRLQVRGAAVFSGYLKNPAATAEAFTGDAWFETGDTARLTADGRLVLSGRVKEIINRGGVKFSPLDVEAIIDRVPGVARSAIVPYPDATLGERACVFVQLAPGASPPSLGAITGALDKAGVAKFKWPERLELIEALPLTPTQKVMRGRLRERLGPAASRVPDA